MIEIRIFGRLRKRFPRSEKQGSSTIIRVEPRGEETLEMLLGRLGIREDELFTIFVNSKLLTTHNRMAEWLEYQQVCENCHRWNLSMVVQDGDRIGLFGRDMPALVI